MLVNIMSEVVSSILKKNGTDLFMVTDSSIIKLVPVARLKKIEEEIERIKSSCDENNIDDLKAKMDHLAKIDSVLKSKGSLVYGGILYQVNSHLPNSIFDNKVNDVVKKKLRDEKGKNPETKAQEVLYTLQTMLQASGEGSAGAAVIGSSDFMRERIYFTLARAGSDVSPNIYCAKYIPSFKIRYEGSAIMGVWEFPSLVIGTRIMESRAKLGDDLLLSFDDTPYVIDPTSYTHPYVFAHDNKICIGSFAGSLQLATIKRESFISALFKFMCQVEAIIVNGFYEDSHPANGLLNASQYLPYKRYGSIDEEARDSIQKAIARIKNECSAAKGAHGKQAENAARRNREALEEMQRQQREAANRGPGGMRF